MKNYGKYIVCVICVVLIICFAISSPDYNRGVHYGGTHAELGTYLLLSAPIIFIIGIVLAIIKQTRTLGLAAITAAGILFLLGFGVCTLK